MDRDDFIEHLLEDVKLVDLSVFRSVLETYRVEWYHNKIKFQLTYGRIIGILEDVGVPDELVFVLHQLVKEIFGDKFAGVKYLPEKDYQRRMTELFRSIRSLKVQVVDQQNPDFEMMKIILKTGEV